MNEDDEDFKIIGGDDDKDDLTPADYKQATKVLVGRAIDKVADEDGELFYCTMNLASILGLIE